ncbi:MAG: hypothetical protein DMG97_03175 [Acidobacteria bacterium]|nr:MAG: hypothetical protein DMG97_03175 [Acidobacteriota bacterium]
MEKSKTFSPLLLLLLITTLVILNFGAQDAKARFTAYGDNGNPIGRGSNSVTLTLPAQFHAQVKPGQLYKIGITEMVTVKDNDDKGKNKDKDKCKGKGKGKDKDKDKCTGEIEVKAGPDQTITLPSSATLRGTASVEGLPAGSTLTTTWSTVSGPGTVTFGDVSALTTTASFSTPGTSILRLTATAGSLIATADVKITVNPGVYYVNVSTGNDSNPGSSSEPWKTIQRAANTVERGATVIVSTGTYDERVQITRSGSKDFPITYRTQGTVIMGGFTIIASYVRIRGFEITNSRTSLPDSTGVFIYGDHNEISNCYIHDILNDGGVVVFGGSGANPTVTNNNLVKNNLIVRARLVGIQVDGQNNVIEGNDVSHTLMNPPGSVPVSGPDADAIRFFGIGNIIRKNYLHDIHLTDVGNHACFEGGGGQCPHPDAFQTFGPASNIIIEDNIVHWTDDGMSGQVPVVNPQWAEIEAKPGLAVTNLIFRNNVFMHETTRFGPTNFDDDLGGPINNISIVNNTFVRLNGPGSGGFGEYGILLKSGQGLLKNVTIKNNAFYDCGSSNSGYVSVVGFTADVDYNAVFVSRGPAPAGGPRPHDVWMADPKFVNFAGRDFHLQSSSPLIDAGVTLPEVSDDLDGTPRPQGRNYDIGVYEFFYPPRH